MNKRNALVLSAVILLIAALGYGLRVGIQPAAGPAASEVAATGTARAAKTSDVTAAPIEAPAVVEATAASPSPPEASTPSTMKTENPQTHFEPTKKEMELLSLLERHRLDAGLGLRALDALHAGKRDAEFQQWLQVELRDHVLAKLHIANWAAENGYIKNVEDKKTREEKPRKKVSPVKSITPKK